MDVARLRELPEFWQAVYAEANRLVALGYGATLAPEPDCDWQQGVCLCPGCGGVVRVSVRPHQTPRVVDADGREHRCERQIAATLQRHGVAGLGAIVARHAERPVVAPPDTAVQAPPWERWR